MRRAVSAPMLVLATLALAFPAFATSGGADRFGGHTPSEKSATAKHPAGVYHCHGKAKTLKRQACDLRVLVDVQERKRIALESELDHARATAARVSDQNARQHATINDLRSRLGAEEAKSRLAVRDRDAQRRIAQTRAIETERAVRDRDEAEARAAGSGPAVSSRCKDAVKAAAKKGGWFGGWDDAAKEALRRGCLYE